MNGIAWRWFGLDLFDAWAHGKPTALRADALAFLMALLDAPFPDFPGEPNPAGRSAAHRIADDGTFRAAFVADRRNVVGALYLASFRGPGDDTPMTRSAQRP